MNTLRQQYTLICQMYTYLNKALWKWMHTRIKVIKNLEFYYIYYTKRGVNKNVIYLFNGSRWSNSQ